MLAWPAVAKSNASSEKVRKTKYNVGVTSRKMETSRSMLEKLGQPM